MLKDFFKSMAVWMIRKQYKARQIEKRIAVRQALRSMSTEFVKFGK